MHDVNAPVEVFPDTNVLVHGRPLHTVPWEELGRDPVEIVICGPVLREIDTLKNRPGRPGKVARALNTEFRMLLAKPGKSEVIREVAPRVTRRLALGLSVREPVRKGLDLAVIDQAIINQAFASMDSGRDVLLLTDDTIAAGTAEEFGLPAMLLPAHWLREPEADGDAKGIARRDAEIARLRSAEPSPQLRFVDRTGTPIERLEAVMKRYQPVPRIEVERMMARVEAMAPIVAVAPSAPTVLPEPKRSPFGGIDIASLGVPHGFIVPVTESDVASYRTAHAAWLETVRRKIAGFHVEWNGHREWPEAELVAVNSGGRPANDVLLEIEANGGFRISRGVDERDRISDGPDWLELQLPPEPPRPRPYDFGSISILDNLLNPSRGFDLPGQPFPSLNGRDDDRFYWRTGKTHPVDVMELECKVWRHGRGEEAFAFRVWAIDAADVNGLIVGRLSASNLTIATETRLPLRITFQDMDTVMMAEQLVDDLERRLTRAQG